MKSTTRWIAGAVLLVALAVGLPRVIPGAADRGVPASERRLTTGATGADATGEADDALLALDRIEAGIERLAIRPPSPAVAEERTR
jgi:hypothetical protein